MAHPLWNIALLFSLIIFVDANSGYSSAGSSIDGSSNAVSSNDGSSNAGDSSQSGSLGGAGGLVDESGSGGAEPDESTKFNAAPNSEYCHGVAPVAGQEFVGAFTYTYEQNMKKCCEKCESTAGCLRASMRYVVDGQGQDTAPCRRYTRIDYMIPAGWRQRQQLNADCGHYAWGRSDHTNLERTCLGTGSPGWSNKVKVAGVQHLFDLIDTNTDCAITPSVGIVTIDPTSKWNITIQTPNSIKEYWIYVDDEDPPTTINPEAFTYKAEQPDPAYFVTREWHNIQEPVASGMLVAEGDNVIIRVEYCKTCQAKSCVGRCGDDDCGYDCGGCKGNKNCVDHVCE